MPPFVIKLMRAAAMEQEKNKTIFESMPVPEAVRKMALPTVISHQSADRADLQYGGHVLPGAHE